MEIIITQEEKGIVAKLNGRLDTVAAQQISDAVAPVLENAAGNIVLDCEDMPFISSSGLRIFLKIRKEVAAQGGTMKVMNVNPDVMQVFKMTKLDEIFDIVD